MPSSIARSFNAGFVRCVPQCACNLLSAVLLLNVVLSSCGCGSASKPATTPSATGQANATTSQEVNRGSEAGGSKGNAPSLANDEMGAKGQEKSEVAAEVNGNDELALTIAPQNGKPAPATRESPSASNSAQIKKIVEPTKEQLARWVRAPFEPLQLLACRESEKTGFVTNIADTPDGRHFILAGSKLTLWSVESTAPEHVFLEFNDAGKDQSIKSLAVAPDGKWFAAGDSEGLIQIWSLSDHKELISKKLYSTGITQIAISPDSQEIATTTYSSEVTIWSADKLDQKNSFKIDTNGLERIMYMSAGSLAAAGETTTSWNVRTGKLEHTLSPGRYNFALARSPDGKWFAFGDKDDLQLWSVANSKRHGVFSNFASNELVEFSPDEKSLVTANGSSLRLWDIASGQVVQVIDVFGWPIVGLSWLPDTNLVLVASQNGRTRIWGTPKVGEPLGLKPMHAAIELPDSSSREPAMPTQLLAAVDLRTFPKLPGDVGRQSSEFNVDYTASVKQEEAELFYRYFLGQNGWSETSAAGETPGAIAFRKNGFMLAASFVDAGEAKTTVSLHHSGNYDLRWTPKFDAAPIEQVYESAHTVLYRTKADLLQIETTLLRKIHEAGWTAYSRLHASHSEEVNSRNISFLKQGAELHVSISQLPADPSSYHVQYSKFLTTRSLPIPQDSGFVEFEGSTEPHLVATTSMNLAQAREFYDRQMKVEGWLSQEFGRSLNEKQNWLPYIRSQQEVTVGLESLSSGRTLIRVGNRLENSSWQLAKPKAVDPKIASVGIEAADFPILNSSASGKYDANDKSLEFQMDATPLLSVADRYTAELKSKGWTTEGAGIRSDDYVFLTFVKEKAEIQLRARLSSGNAVVGIQGDGLLWTKPLPGGKQIISYEAWLRNNRHPASLNLLDAYQAEMRSIAAEKAVDNK